MKLKMLIRRFSINKKLEDVEKTKEYLRKFDIKIDKMGVRRHFGMVYILSCFHDNKTNIVILHVDGKIVFYDGDIDSIDNIALFHFDQDKMMPLYEGVNHLYESA